MLNLSEYIGYRLYFVLANIFSLSWGYMLADIVGYLVFKIKYRESNVRANIMQRICKREISITAAKKLVCKDIQMFNRDLIDFFRSGRLNKGNIDLFVKIKGQKLLSETLKKGKGIVLASIHMGSWEMTGVSLAIKGYPVYGMVWTAGNRLVSGFLGKIRLRKGVGAVDSGALRHIFELLQKNKIIGIMLDVDGGGRGIPYSLWGYNVRLPRGPVAISKKTGAELIIVVMKRMPEGGYTLFIEKPTLTGTEEDLTIDLFEFMRKYIEADPVQWHWIKYFFEPSSS